MTTLHDLPPLSKLTEQQLAALVEWNTRVPRWMLERAARNRMALERLTADDVRRALETA